MQSMLPVLFGSGEIIKGWLEDKWLTSVISCIADKHMKLIENLFLTKEVNDEGIYWLRFFKNGEW